jgi:hypothetical protein
VKFIVRAGHLHASRFGVSGAAYRYALTIGTVKEPHVFTSLVAADRIANYFKKYHGLDTWVDEGKTPCSA